MPTREHFRAELEGVEVYSTRRRSGSGRPSQSLGDWCRRWGFHVEVGASVAAAIAAMFAFGAEVSIGLAVVVLWTFCNFDKGARVTSPLPLQLRVVARSVLPPLAALAVAIGFLAVDPVAVQGAVAAVAAGAAVSMLARSLRWRLQTPIRVLVVGDRNAIARATDRWAGPSRIRAVAALLIEPHGKAPDLPTSIGGIPVVTGINAGPALVDRFKADLVVVAPCEGFRADDFRRLAWALEETKVSLGVLGVLDSVAPHRILPGMMNGATVTDVRLPRPSTTTRWGKAVFDRLGGAVLLLVAAPILLAMVVAVRLDSKGPGFYTQTRVGKNGRHFKVFKMRTMVSNADQIKADLADVNEFDSVLFKMKKDPRVTRVGSLLRRSSLDELPQLINVVRGEMSLVGPRPNLPDEVAQMDPNTLRRLAVRPGITGLWQVSGRSDLSFARACELDVYYADNWSLRGDISILLRTVKAVLVARGAY